MVAFRPALSGKRYTTANTRNDTDLAMPGDNVTHGETNQKQNIQLYDNDNIESIRKEVSIWSQITNIFPKWLPMKGNCFGVICGLCLAQPKDQRELYLFRKIGYRRLNFFVQKLTWREVRLLDTKLVIWCCLNLIAFYQERYRKSRGCHSLLLKRKLDGSRDLFRHVLDLKMPESKIIQHCITYFNITCQWDFEEVITFILQELVILAPKKDLVLSKLIKAIEVSQREGNLNQAHLMTTNVAHILENVYMDRHSYTPKLHKCFSAMLKIYLLNNLEANKSASQVNAEQTKFRIQLKNSIKWFITRMRDVVGHIAILDTIADIIADSDVPNEEQTDLIDLMVHCAQQLRGRLYKDLITSRVVFVLLAYLQSDYRASAMAAQKIIQCLLDRHNNLNYFTEPIYHFKGRSDIVFETELIKENVNFYKRFSREFFAGLYKCLNKYTDTTALVSSYTTLCLILVELPDPVITINVIYVVIKTQNMVLKDKEMYDTVTRIHIHAIVASVLSLICLIHGDEVNALRKYVQEVVVYRNENSPHLLPPLSPEYNIAKHHMTEYHEKLYFLEHEVLCSLKQCWLGRRRSN